MQDQFKSRYSVFERKHGHVHEREERLVNDL